MELTYKRITKGLKEYKKFIALYEEAFPVSERVWPWYLLLMSKRSSVDHMAYYDGGKFCGFTYSVVSDDLVCVVYIAVKAELRSRGYGSAILSSLKEQYKGKIISLNVEVLDEEADNYEQRKRRIRFYQKNEMIDTGYRIKKESGDFYVFANSDSFKADMYRACMYRYSFGTYMAPIYKRIIFDE